MLQFALVARSSAEHIGEHGCGVFGGSVSRGAALGGDYQEGVGGRPAGDQLFGDRPDLVDLAREAIPILTLWVDEPREDPSEAMTDLSDMVRSGATLPM
jgi:hypothetical protein